MSQHQITCINKEIRYNPYERITHVGGFSNNTRWKITQQEAIRFIRAGTYQFYTIDVYGRRAEVIVATSRFGNAYIKTTSDGDEPNNLLSLSECPLS